MESINPEQIVRQFNDCITNQDIESLSLLMTPNHTFIDREGNISGPKENMVRNWQKFFSMVPRYKNTFTKVISKGNIVTVKGYAYWDEKNSHDPAIWVATILDDKIEEWRIYWDTEENQKMLGIEGS